MGSLEDGNTAALSCDSTRFNRSVLGPETPVLDMSSKSASERPGLGIWAQLQSRTSSKELSFAEPHVASVQ